MLMPNDWFQITEGIITLKLLKYEVKYALMQCKHIDIHRTVDVCYICGCAVNSESYIVDCNQMHVHIWSAGHWKDCDSLSGDLVPA